jgi:thiol-disulfide isomerase/thioredoxin
MRKHKWIKAVALVQTHGLLALDRKTFVLFGLFALAFFLLAACGSGPADSATPLPDQPAGNLEHNFAISTLYQDGGILGSPPLQFSAVFDHGEPVVLNMWAGLCPPCRAEMPDMQSVYDQYDGQFILLGIDVGAFTGLGSQADAQALLQELNITYPAGAIEDANVLQNYRVIGMPTTFFIKPDGEIHDTWTGILTRDQFETKVQELIEASQ